MLWLIPHWAMWYLPVLFLWRLATPILAAAPAGARRPWSEPGGRRCRRRPAARRARPGAAALRARPAPPARPAVLAGARFVLALPWSRAGQDLVIARSTHEWARTAFLYYDEGYADLGWQPLPAMWVRLGVMGIGVVGALSVIALVPRRGGWFSAMGAATMVVYLFHGFPVRFVEYAGWPDFAVGHPLPALVLTTLGAVGLALLLASPPVRSASAGRGPGRVLAAAPGTGRRGSGRDNSGRCSRAGTADPRTATLVPPGPGRHRVTRLPIQRSARVISHSQAHADRPQRRQQPRHGHQPGQPPGDGERLAVLVAQSPATAGSGPGARTPGSPPQSSGLEAVVDALAVEQGEVDAGRRIADERPVRPATWETAPPIGSSAEVGARSSPLSWNSSRRWSAYSCMSGRSATSAGRLRVGQGADPACSPRRCRAGRSSRSRTGSRPAGRAARGGS